MTVDNSTAVSPFSQVAAQISNRFQNRKVISKSSRSLLIEAWDSKRGVQRVLKIARINGPIQDEIRCLREVRHRNIVTLHKIRPMEGAMCLVLKKIPGKSLIDILVEEQKMSEGETALISRQISSALEYLHSSGWTHRDIKPDNIMYDRQTKKVKLIDFEFSYQHSIFSTQTLKRGTIEYASPEVRRGSYMGPEIDIWSLGVTIFVLVTGEFPFLEKELLKRKEKFVKPENVSPECADLLSKLLSPNPLNRPPAGTLEYHPWFLKFPKERLKTQDAQLSSSSSASSTSNSSLDLFGLFSDIIEVLM